MVCTFSKLNNSGTVASFLFNIISDKPKQQTHSSAMIIVKCVIVWY